MSFGTIFWDVILGRYFGMLFWDDIAIFWDETVFFSLKNHNKISSQNIVISSQKNVPKYHAKGHEQV